MKTDPPPASLWGSAQVADYLKISQREVQRLAERGDLPSVVVPGMKRRGRQFLPAEIAGALKPLPVRRAT